MGAFTGELQQAATKVGRQSRLCNGCADDEESRDHNDDGIGEPRQGFFGRQDARQHQSQQGT